MSQVGNYIIEYEDDEVVIVKINDELNDEINIIKLSDIVYINSYPHNDSEGDIFRITIIKYKQKTQCTFKYNNEKCLGKYILNKIIKLRKGIQCNKNKNNMLG